LFEVKGSIKRRLVERRGDRREEVCGKERGGGGLAIFYSHQPSPLVPQFTTETA
jgi:hypothetical protein